MYEVTYWCHFKWKWNSFTTYLFTKVYASEEIQITDENIVIADEDTPAQEIIIKVVTKPTYGNLINTEQNEGEPTNWYWLLFPDRVN